MSIKSIPFMRSKLYLRTLHSSSNFHVFLSPRPNVLFLVHGLRELMILKPWRLFLSMIGKSVLWSVIVLINGIIMTPVIMDAFHSNSN